MANSKPISFMKLAYRGITLVDNDEVVVRDRNVPNCIPVVYLDQVIPLDKAFTFTVEYSLPQHSTHSFVLGVTTCTKEKITNGDYHLNELCQESYDCGSITQSIQIGGAGRPAVKNVQITKSRDYLLDIIVNGRSSFNLADRTGKIHGRDLLVFIILSGSARRIRVSESPHGPVESGESEERRKIQILSAFTSSWKLTNGVALNDLIMWRKPNLLPLYVYYTVPFNIQREISFVIKEIDCSWNGSITIGVTSVKPNQVDIECLPSEPNQLNSPPYSPHWRASVNPLPMTRVGSTVRIARTLSEGLTVDFGAGSKPIITQLQEHRDWYLFLYFGGKISKVQFKIPNYILDAFTPAQGAVNHRIVQAALPQYCLGCDTKRVTQIVQPCGHKFFCDDCAETKVRFCLICDGKITF